MASFLAFFKTAWELIKLVKNIKSMFDDMYIKKLEAEQKKKAEKAREATEIVEADTAKPVEERSDEELMKALRKKHGK